MPLPEKPVCPLCNGEEATFINEYDKTPCQCLLAKLWRKHLNAVGPGIASAETILKSPLLLVEDGEITVDRTGDNLFISAKWYALLPHLKLALFCKGMGFRTTIVTDERLRTIYLGKEGYASRSKGSRDDIPTFNSIGDIIGQDFDLVILRLGFLGYKNIAAPGILKEALMLRESAGLPTWVVEEGDGAFYTCFSYSDDVLSYINQHFESMSITSDQPEPVRQVREVIMEVSGNEDPADMVSPMVSVPVYVTPPTPVAPRYVEPTPVVSRPYTPSLPDDDDNDGGPRLGPKKKTWKKGGSH